MFKASTLINEPEALHAAFTRMHTASRRRFLADAKIRRRRLDALTAMLREHLGEWEAAVSADFGHRSPHETRLLEIFPTLDAIRHSRRHLARWMRPQHRSIALMFQPASTQVRYQPLGLVGVVTPWNYPIYLAFGPLISAFTAGNRAMLKMSELTPQTAHLMATLSARYFEADELAVVGGEADLAQAFTHLPFDHLLFTGSTPVGKQVMRAAADNLTPVTLELGGKSPTVITPDYPLRHAAERIMAGKCLNAGQTCIAPDYLLLPKGSEAEFIAAARVEVARCYPNLADTPDYTSIINARHFERLTAYIDDARSRGAEIVELAPGTSPDARTRRFPPVAVLNATRDMRVMQEEIFGPILPVLSYEKVTEALDFIRAGDRPLAFYLFDRDAKRVARTLDATIAGGVTVNDTILHIGQHNLPFGGVGASGMGHYHGHDGFLTFSKQTGVFKQARRNGVGLFKPPYHLRFEQLLRFLMR